MRKVEFAEYSIDLDLFELSRDGEPIKLGRRALDLLIYLIANHERVVTRDLLRADVWNEASLSESAIPTCVLEIRRALDDDPKTPRFIGSVRGRGYRFLQRATYSKDLGRMSPSTIQPLPFTGRSNELDALLECSRAVKLRGLGRVAVVSGEAGIGKTRLVEELILLQTRRMFCLTTKCSTSDSPPSFWPCTQALRAALQNADVTNDELIEHSQRLASAFPEILGSVSPSRDVDVPIDRFSVMTLWIRAFRSIARTTPILLIFEDIHRADADTLSLLSCLAEELASEPIFLVVTYRPPTFDDDRLSRIAEIQNVPQSLQLTLAPLTEIDIENLLDPLLSDRTAVSRTLAERTSGNPFYLTHLIRYFGNHTQLSQPESILARSPLNGSEIVTRQLSELPAESTDALTIASIIGDRFSVHLLASILQTSAANAIRRLEPAVRAWIIRDDGTDYEFSHSLLREALTQNVVGLRKRQIHWSIATELRKHSDAALQAARIADHLTAAIPLSNHADAYSFSMLAARESAARFAYAEAANYFDQALEISKDDPSATPVSKCEAMQELALSLLNSGERQRARNILFRAAQIARETDTPRNLAKCALLLAPDFLSIEVGVVDESLIALLQESLDSIAESDHAYRASLLARLSQANQWTHRPEHSNSLAKMALEEARKSGDRSALVAALAAQSESLHGPAYVHDRIRYIRELGEVARIGNHVPARLLHHTRSITAHLELGQLSELIVENEQSRALATETNLPQYRWYPTAHDSMIAMLRGEIDTAEVLANDFRKTAGERADQNCIQTFGCHALIRAIERDQAHEMIPFLENTAISQSSMHVWSAALPWFYCEAMQLDLARESLEKFSEERILSMSREPGGGIGLALLAEASVLLADQKIIEFLYEQLKPIQELRATVGYGVAYFGSFARYAGLLASAVGDAVTAKRLFTLACRHESSIGAVSWRVYAEVDLARNDQLTTSRKRSYLHRLLTLRPSLNNSNLHRASRKLTECITDISKEGN